MGFLTTWGESYQCFPSVPFLWIEGKIGERIKLLREGEGGDTARKTTTSLYHHWFCLRGKAREIPYDSLTKRNGYNFRDSIRGLNETNQ